MHALQNLAFDDHLVRVVLRDGEPWFVLADVCRVLAHTNPTVAASRLDDDEKTTLNNTEGQAGRGAQSFTIINESGLYSLILTSRKPAAKRFKKWVTSEVLPSIRKTGRYEAPGAVPEEKRSFLGCSLEEMRITIEMINLGYRIGGRAAAMHLWDQSGVLPRLPRLGLAFADDGGRAADDAEDCLTYLLDMPAGDGETVGGRLRRDTAADREALRQYGVIAHPQSWRGYIAVARRHPRLADHFKTTGWAGMWADALVNLPDAKRGPGPMRFNMHPSRVVLIPRELIGEEP